MYTIPRIFADRSLLSVGLSFFLILLLDRKQSSSKRGKNPETIFEGDSVTGSERSAPGDLTKGEVGVLQTKCASKGTSLAVRPQC